MKNRLRQGLGIWELTFAGQTAMLKHEQGMIYVAYLLAHPDETIHGQALLLKTARSGQQPDAETFITDPESGRLVTIGIGAEFLQRSLALDDAETAFALRRKQLELEARLEDPLETEPARAEIQEQLLAIYAHQKRNLVRTLDTAQRAADTVGKAINRLHAHLAGGSQGGWRHPVLTRFAAHLRNHLLIPSGRFGQQGGPRFQGGVPGCFLYQPPVGLSWAD